MSSLTTLADKPEHPKGILKIQDHQEPSRSKTPNRQLQVQFKDKDLSCRKRRSSLPSRTRYVRPTISEISDEDWEQGVEDLESIADRRFSDGDLPSSRSSVRQMLERNYKPTNRSEAVKWVNILCEWSQNFDGFPSNHKNQEENKEEDQKRNRELLCRRESQLRRFIYTRQREESVSKLF